MGGWNAPCHPLVHQDQPGWVVRTSRVDRRGEMDDPWLVRNHAIHLSRMHFQVVNASASHRFRFVRPQGRRFMNRSSSPIKSTQRPREASDERWTRPSLHVLGAPATARQQAAKRSFIRVVGPLSALFLTSEGRLSRPEGPRQEPIGKIQKTRSCGPGFTSPPPVVDASVLNPMCTVDGGARFCKSPR